MDGREITEESLLELLHNSSLGLKPNGAKLDIIFQVKNAISKDEAKFQKAFRKMWGWSGGCVSGTSLFERKREIWLIGFI